MSSAIDAPSTRRTLPPDHERRPPTTSTRLRRDGHLPERHPPLQRPDHRPRPQRLRQPHRHPCRPPTRNLLPPTGQATTVEYQCPSGPRRVRVLEPLGAYLIVRATSGQDETSGFGAPAQLTGRHHASGNVTTLSYRVDGPPLHAQPHRAKPRRLPKPDAQAFAGAAGPRPARASHRQHARHRRRAPRHDHVQSTVLGDELAFHL